MKYLFVKCALYDKAGFAMVQGAVNGIKSLDIEAEFGIMVNRPNYFETSFCKPVIYDRKDPNRLNKMKTLFKKYDIILDVNGIAQWVGSGLAKECVETAIKVDKPYVLSCISYVGNHGYSKEKWLLDRVNPIARGVRSAELIKKYSGKNVPVAADLSFLIEPKKWTGKKYSKMFSTHNPKDIANMFNICSKEDSIQIIWKPDKDGKSFEPKLPIPKFTGTVEENFGLIEAVDEVYTARYQAGCATILSGKKPYMSVKPDTKENRIYNDKYKDLLDLYGKSKEELRKLSMITCETIVKIVRG